MRPHIEVTEVALPGQQQHQGKPFPLVLQCATPQATLADATSWLAAQAPTLIARSGEHGTVLFRGFAVRTAADFDAFVASFSVPNFPYDESLSNAVRINRTPRVFTANEAPPSVTILLHHEMAQTPMYPSHLFFFCEQPAATGGATPVCRSDVLFERLASRYPDFARACTEKGLRYSNVMPAQEDAQSGMGRSWQSTLRATTREEAERRLTSLGYTWEWLADGCLRATTPVLPAVRHLADGRTTFFNQLIAAARGWKDARNDPARAITFGDGSQIDPDIAAQVADLADALAFDLPWQQGDVALLDNLVVLHGRRTFTGTRRVLASLIAIR